MPKYRPYEEWTRLEIAKMLSRQAFNNGYSENDVLEIYKMVYDDNWDPRLDYDGCTLVQDKKHPFLPCFIHDYTWFMGNGGYTSDKTFRENLIQCGMPKWKANMYFIGVRIAWLCFYQFKKRNRKKK